MVPFANWIKGLAHQAAQEEFPQGLKRNACQALLLELKPRPPKKPAHSAQANVSRWDCHFRYGRSNSSRGSLPRVRVRTWYQIRMRITETDENQRGDGVDFRSDAAAEACPNFEREGVVSTEKEKGDGDFVHREGEDEQGGGDEREFEIREGDAPEGLPGSRAEIERGFFLGAIHFLQASEEFGGGDGDERGAVAEEDGEETELNADAVDEHE